MRTENRGSRAEGNDGTRKGDCWRRMGRGNGGAERKLKSLYEVSNVLLLLKVWRC